MAHRVFQVGYALRSMIFFALAKWFVMVAVLLVLGNLFADLMLALLDPRVRRATMSRN